MNTRSPTDTPESAISLALLNLVEGQIWFEDFLGCVISYPDYFCMQEVSSNLRLAYRYRVTISLRTLVVLTKIWGLVEQPHLGRRRR